jgi:hypothetical protein
MIDLSSVKTAFKSDISQSLAPGLTGDIPTALFNICILAGC